MEAEVFLVFFIRIIGEESDGGASGDTSLAHGARPSWMRVLALEIMRGSVPMVQFISGCPFLIFVQSL
jgi:hypothetical protein